MFTFPAESSANFHFEKSHIGNLRAGLTGTRVVAMVEVQAVVKFRASKAAPGLAPDAGVAGSPGKTKSSQSPIEQAGNFLKQAAERDFREMERAGVKLFVATTGPGDKHNRKNKKHQHVY